MLEFNYSKYVCVYVYIMCIYNAVHWRRAIPPLTVVPATCCYGRVIPPLTVVPATCCYGRVIPPLTVVPSTCCYGDLES